MNPVRQLVASIAFAALLTAGSAQTFEAEPNNTTGQANPVSLGITFSGQLSDQYEDVDCFKITVTETGNLTITLAGDAGNGGNGFVISFINSAGVVQAIYSKAVPNSFSQKVGVPSTGVYYVKVSAPGYQAGSSYTSSQYYITATFSPLVPTITPVPNPARLINLSVLTPILTGQPLTAGFVLTGTESKRVLIRAIGPTLSTFGVLNPVSDPTLLLYDSRGVIIGSNDDWQSSNASTMASAGAFALPAGSRDAVIVVTLVPGAYTTAARGFGNASGMVLIEVYEAP